MDIPEYKAHTDAKSYAPSFCMYWMQVFQVQLATTQISTNYLSYPNYPLVFYWKSLSGKVYTSEVMLDVFMQVSVPEKLILYANIDLLSGAQPGWTVSLVDNPGFGEANEHISQIAEAAMNSSSVYIYLVETTAIGGDIDKKFFQELQSRDKGIMYLHLGFKGC